MRRLDIEPYLIADIVFEATNIAAVAVVAFANDYISSRIAG